MQPRTSTRRRTIVALATLVALALLLAANVVVLCTMRWSQTQCESKIEQRVYARILDEVSHELAPAMRDFDIKTSSPPKSFRELLAPFVRITNPIGVGHRAAATGPRR